MFETVVVILLPPEKSNVSLANDTVSSDPLSAPIVKVVVIEAVDTAVTWAEKCLGEPIAVVLSISEQYTLII